MKHSKISGMDIAIVVLLLIAFGVSGYVHMVETGEMGDTAVMHTTEEGQGIKQDRFQAAESDWTGEG